MILAISTTLLAVVAASLFVLRRRLGLFWSSTGMYVATVLFVLYGFDPPTPRSVSVLYVSVATIALGLYLSSSAEAVQSVYKPLRAVVIEPQRGWQRVALCLIVPSLVAWQVYGSLLPETDPPPTVRSAHPAPPMAIDLRAKGEAPHTLDVLRSGNPYRGSRESDPERHAAAVARGRVVYYENCFYCHGDNLAAQGQFAGAMSPPPANFTDVGILPMFVDGFFFWRIAKGGAGLPVDGAPWDSTMPAWESMLSEDEMWSVLTFLSDFTGYEPRVRETYASHAGEEE